MPEIDVDVGNRLAGVNVDNLDIDVEVDASLVLADVPADKLAVDVWKEN